MIPVAVVNTPDRSSWIEGRKVEVQVEVVVLNERDEGPSLAQPS